MCRREAGIRQTVAIPGVCPTMRAFPIARNLGGPTMPRLSRAFALILLLPALPRQAPKVEHRPAEYDVTIEKNVIITTRDGTRLAADIYRPPAKEAVPIEGRFPTLLTRTPYNKNGTGAEGQYYAEHGYNVVANDIRGRYASEGTWRLMADDPRTATTSSSGSPASPGPTARSVRSARAIPGVPSTRWPR